MTRLLAVLPLQAHDAPQPDRRECDTGAGQLDARSHQCAYQLCQGSDSLPCVESAHALKYNVVLLGISLPLIMAQPQASQLIVQAQRAHESGSSVGQLGGCFQCVSGCCAFCKAAGRTAFSKRSEETQVFLVQHSGF